CCERHCRGHSAPLDPECCQFRPPCDLRARSRPSCRRAIPSEARDANSPPRTLRQDSPDPKCSADRWSERSPLEPYPEPFPVSRLPYALYGLRDRGPGPGADQNWNAWDPPASASRLKTDRAIGQNPEILRRIYLCDLGWPSLL